ncbi:MAG: hypothetical protein PHT02_00110 [Tissierellia bacterium]|nr:hypothetical protein [Tissierellia bacterium]
MINEINRKQDETIKSYKIRLFKNKDLYGLNSQNIADLINKETGDTFNESTYRKWYRLYSEGLEDGKKENLSDDSLIKQYEIKKQEFEKEKIKVQTEKLNLNQMLREQARMELFEEKITHAILHRDKNIDIPKHKIDLDYNNDSEMILSIADPHYGADFIIRGMMDEVINEYNPEIFEKRMWEILNKTVSYAERNGFKKVNVLDLDDSIEGILHIGQLALLRYGVVDSLIGYADFMETWINELSRILYVDFNRVKGNHNDLRLLTGKKGDFPHENTSRIITHSIKKGLRDNPNVSINGHNSVGCIYKKIAGFDVLASHGQDEKGNLEDSFKNYILSYKVNVDYFYTGHLHSTNIKEIGINKEIIQTPSIMGINDFSIGLKKTANAGAKITVLTKDYGRTEEHNIILK